MTNCVTDYGGLFMRLFGKYMKIYENMRLNCLKQCKELDICLQKLDKLLKAYILC